MGGSVEPSGRRPVRPRLLTAAFAAVVLTLIVLLALALNNGGSILPRSSQARPAILTLTGIERQIVYEGNTSGSIGPAVNDSCPECPISFPAGSDAYVTTFSYRVNATVPEIAMEVFVNSTIPAEPFGGWSCPTGSSCPPPAVTSSRFFLGEVNGSSSSWGIMFDPPANTTVASDGGMSLLIFVADCTAVDTDWNYCG